MSTTTLRNVGNMSGATVIHCDKDACRTTFTTGAIADTATTRLHAIHHGWKSNTTARYRTRPIGPWFDYCPEHRL